MAGFGIRLVRSAGMEGITGNLNDFAIDPANTNPIFTGDPVLIGATGFAQEATGGANNNDFDIWGVFMGCSYVDAEGSIRFRHFWNGVAGSTEVRAHVAMPPHSVFYIKGTAGTTYTRAGTVGKRFGVVYAAGSTLYGDSRISLGTATAATGPLVVHRLADLPGNTFDIDEPVFEVSVVRQQGAS